MLDFHAPGLAGTCVQYSPFIDNRIALGASANFGIVGNGKLFSLELLPTGVIAVQNSFDTQDSIFSLAWSETHENLIVVACGDGSVQLFDCSQRSHPVAIVREHTKEVTSVNWNMIEKQEFCSGSRDGLIRVWRVAQQVTAAQTLQSPSPVSQAKYSPHTPTLLASAQSDGSAYVWDTRMGSIVSQFRSPNPQGGECLTTDWNKYRQGTLASAGSDGVIRIWDMRSTRAVLVNELRGHELAVKSVKWSPHSPVHLLSASYDMTARVWQDNQDRVVAGTGPRGLLREFARHTEFVTDCDWSLWGEPGWVATTSYDSNMFVWKV